MTPPTRECFLSRNITKTRDSFTRPRVCVSGDEQTEAEAAQPTRHRKQQCAGAAVKPREQTPPALGQQGGHAAQVREAPPGVVTGLEFWAVRFKKLSGLYESPCPAAVVVVVDSIRPPPLPIHCCQLHAASALIN